MKTIYILVLMALVFISCGKETKKESDIIAKKNEVSETVTAFDKQMKAGKKIYAKLCAVCHQANGKGISGAFPPVAKSDYLNENTARAIEVIIQGKTGEITVNGVKYNSAMTPQPLNNQEVADVLTYVYNSWGNNKTVVSKELVEKIKAEL